MSQPLIHLLQVSDVLDLELAQALADSVEVVAWKPERTARPGRIPAGQEREELRRTNLRVRNLPLLPGFARPPISWLARTGPTVLARLLAQTPEPESTPLILTVPYFASLAELWPGPVVYWLTDLIAEYSSANRAQVQRLDRRLCAAATLLCPNSQRLAAYPCGPCGCRP